MMKKGLLILLCLPMIGFGQVNPQDLKQINNYKYIVIDQIKGDGHFKTVKNTTYRELTNAGYNVILSQEITPEVVVFPDDLIKNPNLGLYLIIDVLEDLWYGNETVSIYMYDNNSNLIFKSVRKGQVVRESISSCLSTLTNFRYKYDPTGKSNRQKRVKNGEWAGNGSGIIISKSGYIITNHHVIEDADDIEVEFILDDEVQKFNAEIVQSDKVNDLAIIKIVDVNFDGVKELPYNFKTRSSDVGTKVYAFGYPMALSIMGKEIKVTDGIISSKTGYDGDITTYQISAPIQGGNSGGPLFDDKGNLIGINAAKLNVKIADNVGYSIKTSYVLNLIDILPKTIDLPSNKKLASLPLTEQIKEISKYVVLVKVK